MKWKVHVFGNPDGDKWEISVVREDNEHGFKSWGWFDERKLLVSHNGGPCCWPLAKGLGDKMLKLAHELCTDLNSPTETAEIKMSNKLCERESHDCFGEPYENCQQCFVRDNGPCPENPWLMTEVEFIDWHQKINDEAALNET